MISIRNSRSRNRLTSIVAAGASLALASLGLVAGAGAAEAAVAPLSGTVTYTTDAAYIDSVRGTSITVNLTGSSYRDTDSVYFGVIEKVGDPLTQVRQMDPSDDSKAGYHASASVSFLTWKLIGTIGWRTWIDANDNGKYDLGEKTLASTDATAFRFAGPPTNIALTTSFDEPADATTAGVVFVAEGTCRVFHANVTDENNTGVKGQQLVLSFDAAPGSKPIACSADQLAGLNLAGAATTQDSANVVTAATNNDGGVDFAIQGVKGKSRYRGAMNLQLKVASPKTVTATPVLVQTKTGYNIGVTKVAASGVDAHPSKRSKSQFTLTATNASSYPLAGVLISAASAPGTCATATAPDASATITGLALTNAAGQTVFTVDTSVVGTQCIYTWADLGTKGLDIANEIYTQTEVTVEPQKISAVNSQFSNDADSVPGNVVPSDKVNIGYLLTLHDGADHAVADVDVTFAQVKDNLTDSSVTIVPVKGTTDAQGQIALNVTRLATDKTNEHVCVKASVTGTANTFTSCFYIELRQGTALTLVTPSRFTAINSSQTAIKARLIDQFGDGLASAVVSFTSTEGRNKNQKVQATTDSTGNVTVQWTDTAGAGTVAAPNAVYDLIAITHVRASDSQVISASTVRFDYVLPADAIANGIVLNVPAQTSLVYDNAVQPVQVATGLLKSRAGNPLFGRTITVTLTGPGQLVSKVAGVWTPANQLQQMSDGDTGGFTIAYRATGSAAPITFSVTDGSNTATFTSLVVANSNGAKSIAVSADRNAALTGQVVRATVTVTDVYGNVVTPDTQLCGRVSGIGRFTTGTLKECLDVEDGHAMFDLMTMAPEAGSMTLNVTPRTLVDQFDSSAKGSATVTVTGDTSAADLAAKVALLVTSMTSLQTKVDGISTTTGAMNTLLNTMVNTTLMNMQSKLDAIAASSTGNASQLDVLVKAQADMTGVLKQTTDLLSQANGQLVAVNTVLGSIDDGSAKYSKLVASMKTILAAYAKAAKLKVKI